MTVFIADLWDQENLEVLESTFAQAEKWRKLLGGQYVKIRRWGWFPLLTKWVWRWDEGRGPADCGDTIRIPRFAHYL